MEMAEDSSADVARLLPFRRGHFEYESGHHGDAWLDLELLCLNPAPVRRLASELARRLEGHGIEVVCGPLIEGAFVALMVSEALGLPFVYSERLPKDPGSDLFGFRYVLPRGLRGVVNGRRVAIVNDVINAGSAVRGTLADLRAAGATVVAIGALAVLGPSAAALAAQDRLPLETLLSLQKEIWVPAECPLCARKVPLPNR
jgi:orotate phosphoribosyltransferase